VASLRDRPRDERTLGRPPELVADESRDAGTRRGGGHLTRLSGVERERLLTHDVLARGDRVEHQTVVGVRWGRDAHRVDVG